MPESIGRALQFIRFSHTIFAMPFALGAMLVAARGMPSWRIVGLIALAMVLARTAAMIFNRVVDWEIDQRNPRTVDRHTLVSRPVAIALLVFSSAAFIGSTWWINPLCFWLSPVALIIIFFYSLTKRFTSFSHFFLGLALSVSPVGAWLAVRGHFDLPPLVLALAVMLWVAGFDMIYATLDEAFDRSAGLHSWAVRRGVDGARRMAGALHWVMWTVLGIFGWEIHLGVAWWIGWVMIGLVLIWEHSVASRGDIGSTNAAFFKANAIVGAIFVGALWLELVVLN